MKWPRVSSSGGHMSKKTQSRKLTIAMSRGGSLKNLAGSKNKTVTWPELVEMLSTCDRDDLTMAQYLKLPTLTQSTRKNRPGAFVGGSFSNGRRNSDSINFRSVVTLDIDSHCGQIWEDICLTGGIPGLSGLAYQIHTTRKHTPEAPRLRVCLPLSRDVSPEEYVPVLCAVAEMVDPEMKAVTSESFVAVQVMFLPSACSDGEFFCTSVDGDFLDPDPLLKKYPVDQPELWPSCADASIKPFSRMKITHPEDKKEQAPIITAVHRTYDPRTFIESFLDHVYQPAGNRYLPVGATGAPSVRIYEDAFIQSDHGSDPARGQHNTFDLGRIHLFGELDEDFDTDVMPPSEWPSYKAMCEWALEQEGVADALVDVEAEVREERINEFLDELDDLSDEDELDDETDDDDLIGGVSPKKEKRSGADELIRRLRKLLGRAQNMEDLEAATVRVQAIPDDVLSDSARSVLCNDLQKAFERCGETISKANAAKALRYRQPSARVKAGDEIPKWATGWYYLYGESTFMHADTCRVLSKEAFDALFMHPMGLQVGFTASGTPVMSASTAALTVWDMPMAFNTKFVPGGEELIQLDGVTYVNSYRKAVIPDDGYRGNRGVKLLLRLLNDLYPDKRHQSLILDFLAHAYLHPERKLKYALLLKGANEEGKTMLFRLLRRLLGARNCATVLSAQLKKEFNDYIDGKLLCCIEEIKLKGRDGEDALNNLKAPISNEDISVEGKGTKVRDIENFCNWLVFTNFEDAVPIEDDDSRWLIIFSRFKSNAETAAWKEALLKEDGGDYRDKLYDEIDQHPWQFIRFFEKYQFSADYRPSGRAPHTVFKALVNEDGRSEERTVLEDLIEDQSHPLITDDYVHVAALKDAFDERGIGASFRGRGVSVLMKGAGFTKCRKNMITVGDTNVTISGWTRNGDFCDVEGRLTPQAVDRVRSAFKKAHELEGMDESDGALLRLVK